MRKIILMAVAMLGIATATMAEDGVNRHFKKGYTADVQLTVTDIDMFHITSSHGWSFGNGLYLGGGAGFGAEWDGDVLGDGTPHYVPSLFVNARWSMLNTLVSPYLDVKATQYIDLAEGATNYGVTPSVGLDCGRFSLGFGYAIRRADKSAMQVNVGFVF